jgi:hypothetical protein
MSHRTIPDHTYHFPHFILFVSSSFGIFGCTEPRRDCTSFHGKKGHQQEGTPPIMTMGPKVRAQPVTVKDGLKSNNDKDHLIKAQ